MSLAQKELEGEGSPRIRVEEKKIVPKSGSEGSPSNVVRVIDAEAIKARLASEGRSFHRRGGGGRPGSAAGPGSPSMSRPPQGPKPYGTDREITAPQIVDAAGGPPSDGGQRLGARPSKKKKGPQGSYSREMRDTSSGGRELWLAPGRKKKSALKAKGKNTVLTQAAAHKRVVEMTDAITVNDLAHRMAIKAGQVVSKLLGMGMMVTVNEAIDRYRNHSG